MNTTVRGVRIAYDTSSRHLYYHGFEGQVFRIEQPVGSPAYDVPIANANDHGINYLQGMVFVKGMMILVGNYKQSGVQGYGLVVKGIRQPDGNWQWSRLMQTAPYPSSTTMYDHAFNAVCATIGQDSIYVNSGSRTDHGEEETTGGLYPNTREVALTATIFKLPLSPSQTIVLPNDSTQLAQSGYVFCRGVRNEFDLALDKYGRLFGVENSGDRDDPEEMNWLRQGHHYGFPWEMGGNQTPQQFAGYDPSQDKLLPATLSPDQRQKFHNDPGFPKRPTGLIITQPIMSNGPSANFVRNPLSGSVVQTTPIASFSGHRSPLGLIFDTDNALAGFTGDAFTLSYSAGGGVRGGYLFSEDSGEDMQHIRLRYDGATNNFIAQTTKVVQGFMSPTDAERIGNIMYVIEEGRQCIWQLTFAPITPAITADLSLQYQTAAAVVRLNQPTQLTLTVRNSGPGTARSITIENRLPPNLTYTSGSAGLTFANGQLTGMLDSLGSGQTYAFVYQATPTAAGTYYNAAQVLSSGTYDPDSQPGTGTADGQDDATLSSFRTYEPSQEVYGSPNPNQVPLPAPRPDLPTAAATQADLSLRLAANVSAAAVNSGVSISVIIANAGGAEATSVGIAYTLPAQLTFVGGVGGAGWSASGQTLLANVPSIAPKTQTTLVFQARITAVGTFESAAQLISAAPADPDSTPNNGLQTGEDDTAFVYLRGYD